MAATQIRKRIEKYAASEIKFNLMALVQDKMDQAKSELSKLTLIQAFLRTQLGLGEMSPDDAERL